MKTPPEEIRTREIRTGWEEAARKHTLAWDEEDESLTHAPILAEDLAGIDEADWDDEDWEGEPVDFSGS